MDKPIADMTMDELVELMSEEQPTIDGIEVVEYDDVGDIPLDLLFKVNNY